MSLEKTHTAKELQSLIAKEQAEISALETSISNAKRTLNIKRQNRENLKRKLTTISNSDEPKVSEHALLRYLQRVKGIDLEELVNEILTDSVVEQIKKLGGNGTYPNGTCKLVMKNYNVVTIKI